MSFRERFLSVSCVWISKSSPAPMAFSVSCGRPTAEPSWKPYITNVIGGFNPHFIPQVLGSVPLADAKRWWYEDGSTFRSSVGVSRANMTTLSCGRNCGRRAHTVSRCRRSLLLLGSACSTKHADAIITRYGAVYLT